MTKHDFWLHRVLAPALALGLFAGILLGLYQAGQQAPALQKKLLRLHVVAASDSQADQAQKLQVRDAVLLAAGPLLEEAGNLSEATAALSAALPELQAAAGSVLGPDTPVTVTLGEEFFPPRDYGTFSLPEGVYQALRVTIGKGEGHNWWCVVFPALCLCATTEEVAVQAAAAGFTQEEITVLTQGTGGIVFRWRVAEWWRALEGRLG